MARIPEKADLIENPISGAPGYVIENVYVMAGVPTIFQSMLKTVLPNLKKDPLHYHFQLNYIKVKVI